MNTEEAIDKLTAGLKNYDLEGCRALSKTALESGVDTVKVVDSLTGAIREVGEAFQRSDIFLPEYGSIHWEKKIYSLRYCWLF